MPQLVFIVLVKSLPELLPLLNEIIQTATFSDDEIQKLSKKLKGKNLRLIRRK